MPIDIKPLAIPEVKLITPPIFRDARGFFSETYNIAALAAAGHSNLGMAGAIGFENFASGIGGVTVVAYLSALCNLRFTATQYALLSALASIAGRFLTGTTAGTLIDAMGYVSFYLLTTAIAVPGVVLFWFMIRSGLADLSIGSAGKETTG